MITLMKSGALKKTLSVLLSVLMVLGTVSSLGVLTAMAATDGSPAHPDAYLRASIFPTAGFGMTRQPDKTGCHGKPEIFKRIMKVPV